MNDLMEKKVLLVSPVGPPIWGLVRCYENAFIELGAEVLVDAVSRRISLFDRIENKLGKYFKGISRQKKKAPHIIELVDSFKPNIIIFMRCELLHEEVLEEIKRKSTATLVNIYPDSPFVIPGESAVEMSSMLSNFDLICTFAKSLVPVFYQLGARNVMWLPFAHDPSSTCLVDSDVSEDYLCDIAYLGCWGKLQESWLKELIGWDLRIYGPGWEKSKAPEIRECWRPNMGMGIDMSKAIEGAKIQFNLVRAEHGCAHSMKTFEIPAFGGVSITNESDEQLMFFSEGEGVFYFESKFDLRSKVSKLLSNQFLIEEARRKGLEKVKEFTYNKRVSELLATISKLDA